MSRVSLLHDSANVVSRYLPRVHLVIGHFHPALLEHGSVADRAGWFAASNWTSRRSPALRLRGAPTRRATIHATADISEHKKPQAMSLTWSLGGAACRTRTDDLLITKTLLTRPHRSEQQLPAHRITRWGDLNDYDSSLAAVNAAARAGSRPNARAPPTWST
jgi:hypothetical protein